MLKDSAHENKNDLMTCQVANCRQTCRLTDTPADRTPRGWPEVADRLLRLIGSNRWGWRHTAHLLLITLAVGPVLLTLLFVLAEYRSGA